MKIYFLMGTIFFTLAFVEECSWANWDQFLSARTLSELKKMQWVQEKERVAKQACQLQLLEKKIPTVCWRNFLVGGKSIRFQHLWSWWEAQCTRLPLMKSSVLELSRALDELPKSSQCWRHVSEALHRRKYQMEEDHDG